MFRLVKHDFPNGVKLTAQSRKFLPESVKNS